MEKKIKNIFVQGPIKPSFLSDSILGHQKKTNIGGHALFLGQVRADSVDDRVVEAIQYTSYQDMALETMHQIREATFASFPLICMHVYHSLGIVACGQISLVVFTSSKHRKPAIQACDFLVTQIKTKLPIWGKECFQGDWRWKENNTIDD